MDVANNEESKTMVCKPQQPNTLQEPPYDNEQITSANSSPKPAVVYESYKSRLSCGLGVVQLLFGVAAVVINVLGIIFNSGPWHYVIKNEDGTIYEAYWQKTEAYTNGLAGFWAPVFFTMSGVLAIVVAKKRTFGFVLSHSICAVLASLAAVAMFGISVWAVGQDAARLIFGLSVESSRGYGRERLNNITDADARIQSLAALSVVYFVVSIIEVVACMLVASLGLRVLEVKDLKGCCTRFSCPCTCVLYMAFPKLKADPLVAIDSFGQPIPGAKVVQMLGVDRSGQPVYISPPELSKISVSPVGMAGPPEYEPSDATPLIQPE